MVQLQAALLTQRSEGLHRLQLYSGIALAIMAVVSAALGWLVAGRVLAPLRTISAAADRISDANLHERLAMSGRVTRCASLQTRLIVCWHAWRLRLSRSDGSSRTRHMS